MITKCPKCKRDIEIDLGEITKCECGKIVDCSIQESMKPPTEGEKWNKLLLELVGIVNRTRPGQVTHKIEEIKIAIQSQRKEIVEKIKKDINKLEKWGCFDAIVDGQEAPFILKSDLIKYLSKEERE